MNKRSALIGLVVLFFGGIMSLYWLRLGFDNLLLRESLYLVPSLFATLAGVFALFTFGLSGARFITLLLLTVGMAYWLCGEVLFSYYEYILHIDPYPSIADLFYVLGYPLFFTGLINEIGAAKVNWHGISKPNIFLFILVSLLFGALIAYFGIYQAYDINQPWLNNTIAISYGVGDLLLILATILLLILVWEFRGGKLSRVWILLFLSFVCTLIADILFAMYTQEYNMQVWFYKSLLDTFWMTGYILFGIALCEFGFSVQDAYKKAVLQAKEKGIQFEQTELIS